MYNQQPNLSSSPRTPMDGMVPPRYSTSPVTGKSKGYKNSVLLLGKNFVNKVKSSNLFSSNIKDDTVNSPKIPEDKKLTLQHPKDPQELEKEHEEAKESLRNASTNDYFSIRKIIKSLNLSTLDMNTRIKLCHEILDLPCGQMVALVLADDFLALGMKQGTAEQRIVLLQKIIERSDSKNANSVENLMEYLSSDMAEMPRAERIKLFRLLISQGTEMAATTASCLIHFDLEKDASLLEENAAIIKLYHEILDLPCGLRLSEAFARNFPLLRLERATVDQRIELFKKIVKKSAGRNTQDLGYVFRCYIASEISDVPVAERLKLFRAMIFHGQEMAAEAISRLSSFGLEEAALEECVKLCIDIADSEGEDVVSMLPANFDKLGLNNSPASQCFELCTKILEKGVGAANALVANFDKIELTRENRLKLCVKFAKSGNTIKTLFDNFNKLGLGTGKENRLELFDRIFEEGNEEASLTCCVDKLGDLTKEEYFKLAQKIAEKGPLAAASLAENLEKFQIADISSEDRLELYRKIAKQGVLSAQVLAGKFDVLGLLTSSQKLKLCKELLNQGVAGKLTNNFSKVNLNDKELFILLGYAVSKGLQSYFFKQKVLDSIPNVATKRQFLIDLLSPPSGVKGSVDLSQFSSFADEIKPILTILDKTVDQVTEDEFQNLKAFIKQNPKLRILELEIENIEKNAASKIEMDLKADLEKSVENRRGEANIRKDAEFIRQGLMGWAAYAAGILYDLPENQIALFNQTIDQGVRKDQKNLDCVGVDGKLSYRYTFMPQFSLLVHSINKQFSIDLLSSPSGFKVTDEIQPLLTILNKPINQISEDEVKNLKAFIKQNPKLEILDLEIENIEKNIKSKIEKGLEADLKKGEKYRKGEAKIRDESASIRLGIMRWAANAACVLCNLPDDQIVLLNQKIARGEDPTFPTILNSIASYGKPSFRYTFMREFSHLVSSSVPLQGFDPKWKDSTYLLTSLTDFGLTKEKQNALCAQIEKTKYMKDTEYSSTLAQLLLLLSLNGPFEPEVADRIAQSIIDSLKPSSVKTPAKREIEAKEKEDNTQTKTEVEAKEKEDKLAQAEVKKGGENAEKYKIKKDLVALTNILQIFGKEGFIDFTASQNRDATSFFQANVEKFFVIDSSEDATTATVSTIAQNFERTFGQFRDPMAIFTYYRTVRRFPNGEKAKVEKILNVFVNSVIQNNFHAMRYNPANSFHLQKVFADPKWKQLWCTSSTPKPIVLMKTSEAEVKENKEASVSQYEIMETDDPCDLLLIGSEGKKSCQTVQDSAGNNNKALPSFLMNGEIRLIAIKREGKIVARAAIRLLWDEAKQLPVMLQEKVYSSLPNTVIEEAINDWAKEKAKAMGVHLVVGGTEPGEQYDGTVEGLNGFAPYVYSDAFGGLQDGPYRSDSLRIRYAPPLRPED